MTFSKRNGLTLLTGSLVLFLSLAIASGQAQAGEVKELTEKGKPGSGIKDITHVYRYGDVNLPLLRRPHEVSRTITYDNGDVAVEQLRPNGLVRERMTTYKNGTTVVDTYRPLLQLQLWTRKTYTTNPKESVTEYFGLDGKLKLTRVIKPKVMEVTFSDLHGTKYVQHWTLCAGTPCYKLSWVEVFPANKKVGYHAFHMQGGGKVTMKVYAADGSLTEVRVLLANGTIVETEVWVNGVLQRTVPGLGARQSMPSWTFDEIGGPDDPTVPR